MTHMTRMTRLARFDPGLRELRAAALTMAAVLASYGSALALKHAEHLPLNLVVLAVVLALSLSRTDRAHGPRERLLGIALLPLVAVGANEVGQLLVDHADIGDALFVLAASASIWLRRFGPGFSKAGTLIALPFVALLITPVVGVGPHAHPHVLWAAAIGAIAYFWVAVLKFLAQRTGFITQAPVPPSHPREAPSATAKKPPPERSVHLLPSDRMALQMGVALAVAFATGRALFGLHWSWLVITAFIVCSGNRGRGDVVYKSALRIAGATVGTIAATLIAGAFPPADSASVIAIFIVLALATWLRPFSYVYWAAGVTSVLALLFGYFGETGAALLPHRLEGIVIGAAIGIAASWLILPIRSTDVLRRLIANALAALSDLLAAITAAPDDVPFHAHRFDHAVARLDEIAKPHEAHRFLTRTVRSQPHPADALDATRRCREPVRAIAAATATDPATLTDPAIARRTRALAAKVGQTRRALGGRELQGNSTDAKPAGPAADETPSASPLEQALTELDAALTGFTAGHAQALRPAQTPPRQRSASLR
jgi:Fusaric acid resistance protein-like